MIGKLIKGSFVKGVLQYHYQKIEKGEAKIIDTNIYSSDQTQQLHTYLNVFSLNYTNRRKDYFMHTPLSFHKSEHLDDQLLKTISQEYMDRMGYREVPYTVFLHNDTEHQHVHILASRVNYEGELAPVINNKSAFDKKISREQCQILEKKYGLVIASEIKSNKKESKLSEINAQRYAISNALKKSQETPALDGLYDQLSEHFENKQPTDSELESLIGQGALHQLEATLLNHNLIQYSKKHILKQRIQKSLEQSITRQEFESNCKKEGLYVRAKKTNSGMNYVYGLPDDSFYLGEHQLETAHRFKHIEQKKERSQQHFKSFQSQIQNITKASNNRIELEVNLEAAGISYEYSYTNKGQTIQGISFKDSEGKVYKGSKLHRSLSWSNISKGYKRYLLADVIKENYKLRKQAVRAGANIASSKVKKPRIN